MAIPLRNRRILSTPAVYINGELVPVIPNSVRITEPGEMSVMAVSAGGGAVASVVGLNAETLVAKVSLSIAHTAANVELVRELKQLSHSGVGFAVSIVDGDQRDSFEYMVLINEAERAHEAEGQIELEMQGDHVTS